MRRRVSCYLCIDVNEKPSDSILQRWWKHQVCSETSTYIYKNTRCHSTRQYNSVILLNDAFYCQNYFSCSVRYFLDFITRTILGEEWVTAYIAEAEERMELYRCALYVPSAICFQTGVCASDHVLGETVSRRLLVWPWGHVNASAYALPPHNGTEKLLQIYFGQTFTQLPGIAGDANFRSGSVCNRQRLATCILIYKHNTHWERGTAERIS